MTTRLCAALAALWLVSPAARAQPATGAAVETATPAAPEAETAPEAEAENAAEVEAERSQPSGELPTPRPVYVGMYLFHVPELDLSTNSYLVDF